MNNNKFSPKNWGIWIVVGIMNCVSKLPLFTHKYIVLTIGLIIKPILKSLNNIAYDNLKIAFP
ncbi:LPS biosynthesis protein, partial [Francisella tularensis subsp. holarctica]|nr:LPS biosynthesis protein [Francisella tularensis subsp. holarctica]